MNSFKYIIRSIIYYRKQHAGLFMGMALSAAVLTGALIIGDSIQYSLEKKVESRLGNTEIAVIGGSRFMETGLASKLENIIQAPVSPVLMLRGIAINPASDKRINQATILGIDETFNIISLSPLPVPAEDEAIINENLAGRLGLKPGDEMVLRVQSTSVIPVNAPFSREPAPTVAVRLNITAIATEDQAGMFNLSNNQSGAFNIFVSLHFLGQKMDLAGLSNALLIARDDESMALTAIEDSIQRVWSLKDMGLSVKIREDAGTFDLISDRIFIDTVIQHVAEQKNLPYEEVITYLVNDIGYMENHTPYSFASAVSPAISGTDLREDEVIINRWTADDLNARIGDSVVLTYYEIGPMRKLYETGQSFIIKEIIENDFRTDSSLMPKFPGLSEAGNCSDWDAGVPIDLKRIRDKDEKYWDDYRGTPKVLLSLAKGKKMWENPFGSATSLRFQENLVNLETLTSFLVANVNPVDLGFQVIHVRGDGINAAGNAVNFTELFLGLSFFIIAAGLLLTILIYSLHFNNRSSETAILSGLGLSRNKIVRMRISETSLVILSGCIAGSWLGILYNELLITGINTIWNDMVRMDMLTVHVKWRTLFTGAFISMLVAMIPVYIVTMRKLKEPVIQAIRDRNEGVAYKSKKSSGYIPGIVLVSISFVLVLISFLFEMTDAALPYLVSGAFVLLGGLSLANGIIKVNLSASVDKIPSVASLALSNLKRNRGRSLAVIALLAAGTFAVILTGSYRKTFYGTEEVRQSGTGGYLLWAETISPLLFDLNSRDGRERLILDDSTDLNDVHFLQFEKLEGDDASCLNLNQAQHPEILAVNPSAFDSVGAFTFVKTPDETSGHPWLELNSPLNDTTFQAFADHTVLKYSLKKQVGDTLYYLNEAGNKIGLVITGSIDNSIFQGNILISDKIFRKQFPSSGGTRVLLADGPLKKLEGTSSILSRSLADYGIDIIPAGERLATFNSVENTYLSVFMALSGLGFIIGTVGLGIILLRNVNERRKELALMQSIGFRRQQLFNLVFIENLYLLVSGWGLGMLAALIGILPSLLSPSFDLQGGFMILLTAGIFVSGLLWIYFPLRSAMQKPLIPSLRNE